MAFLLGNGQTGSSAPTNKKITSIFGRTQGPPLQIKYHSNLCDTFWGRGQKRSLHDTFSGPVPKRVTYKLQFDLHICNFYACIKMFYYFFIILSLFCQAVCSCLTHSYSMSIAIHSKFNFIIIYFYFKISRF